jgi:hypothetical protein
MRRTYLGLFIVLFILLPITQAQGGIGLSPGSGPPGTVVTVTNSARVSAACGFAAIPPGGSASFTVPMDAAAGSVITVSCTGPRGFQLSPDSASFTVTALDTDGDGLADSQDPCPFVFGLREDNGCPPNPQVGGGNVGGGSSVGVVAPPTPQIVLPRLPTAGRCVVATRGTDWVNMRNAPSRDGEVVETIDPLQLYQVYVTIDSSNWYHIIIIGRPEEPRRHGFVAASVVRRGGDCSDVLDADDTPSALGTILFVEMMFRRTMLDARE